jgi:hypothetical protein
MRRDRLVASLTMTRKIAGVAVPLGIVDASHRELQTDVDERLSALIGVELDLLGGEGED